MPLHPQVQELVDRQAALGLPRTHELGAVAARAQAPAAAGPPPAWRPAVAEVEDVRTASGLRLRRYQAAETTTGALAWFHGGGWVVGSIDKADAACRHLAAETGLEVFSADYRQAPEEPFPAAVEDAVDALAHVAGRAAGRPLAVGGDSAGGNLAAVAARRARDAGGPALDLQVLVYPITSPDTDTASYREHGDAGLPLGRDEMLWFWDQYVPDPARRTDPDASPLLADDLTGLPPAIVVVAEYDPLRDDGLAYADRLRDAGVPTELVRVDDLSHGFFSQVDLFDRSREVHAQVGRLVRERLVSLR